MVGVARQRVVATCTSEMALTIFVPRCLDSRAKESRRRKSPPRFCALLRFLRSSFGDAQAATVSTVGCPQTTGS